MLRNLQIKELQKLCRDDPEGIGLALEPTGKNYSKYRVVIYRHEKRYGVLRTWRGEERDYSDVDRAVRMLKRTIPTIAEIRVLTRRKLDE